MAYTAPPHGLAYDPFGDRWSALPGSPLRGRTGHLAVWSDSQMLVWGGIPARETDPTRAFTDGAAYTPYGLQGRGNPGAGRSRHGDRLLRPPHRPRRGLRAGAGLAAMPVS